MINDNVLFGFGFGLLRFLKFFIELVNAAISSDETLLTSVEWVAIRAGINFDFFQSGSGLECCATADAGDGALMILWLDVFLHILYSFRRTVIAAQRDTRNIIRKTLKGCNLKMRKKLPYRLVGSLRLEQ